jgi:hypothetical protein
MSKDLREGGVELLEGKIYAIAQKGRGKLLQPKLR